MGDLEGELFTLSLDLVWLDDLFILLGEDRMFGGPFSLLIFLSELLLIDAAFAYSEFLALSFEAYIFQSLSF